MQNFGQLLLESFFDLMTFFTWCFLRLQKKRLLALESSFAKFRTTFIKDFFWYYDFFERLIFDIFSKRVPKRIFDKKKYPKNLWKNFLGKVKKFQVGLALTKNRKTLGGTIFGPPPPPWIGFKIYLWVCLYVYIYYMCNRVISYIVIFCITTGLHKGGWNLKTEQSLRCFLSWR